METDVCVIGSGPSGSMVAYELSKRGYDVMVLERGKYVDPSTLDIARTAHADFDTLIETTVFDGGFTVKPTIPVLMGGGGEVYNAVSPRFLAEDFKLQSACGANFADVVDWPFGYEQLEGYYSKVENIIGVSAIGGKPRFEHPRSSPYPLPPLKVECAATAYFDEAALRAQYHPFIPPVAILSETYEGRPPCPQCGYCVGHVCLYAAKSSPTVTTLLKAANTGKCRIVEDARVDRVELSGKKAVAVEYINSKGRRFKVGARCFVLAAGPVHTACLLMQTTTGLFPSGVGNHGGLLGRYFCYHLAVHGTATYPESVFPLNTFPNPRALDDTYFGDHAEDVGVPRPWKGGCIGLNITSGFKVGAPPDHNLGFGPGLLKSLKNASSSQVRLTFLAEMLPNYHNRVSLSGKVDSRGFLIPKIDCQLSEVDRQVCNYGKEQLWRILNGMGAQGAKVDDQTPPIFHAHMSGTCRMGTDPSTSVVDVDGRVHHTENIFVADASLFPSGGSYNPTLTIQANALRIASGLGERHL